MLMKFFGKYYLRKEPDIFGKNLIRVGGVRKPITNRGSG